MGFAYDPEIETALQLALERAGGVTPPEATNWREVRATTEALLAAMERATPPTPNVSFTTYDTAASDGTVIPMRWYRRDGNAPGSAVLYVHGGGMIIGRAELYERYVSAYVAATGVPMLVPDYRVAPEHPHPLPVEDCYGALTWLFAHASTLEVDPDRIGVMGDSAGGGLAAGVALLARDRSVRLSRQILLYPMLDDRTVDHDPALVPFAHWTYEKNRMGWTALLGDARGDPDVPASASPARAKDLSGLAPAYVEVGELDIFRDESIEYARRMAAAGVSIELHVHPGAPHGFERAAPKSAVARRALADRYRVLASL